jgi:predicted glycosyltransferase
LNILIDIGHPAHVHYFKHLAAYFVEKGSQVLFTCRDKEVTIQLLNHYSLNYISLGKPFKSTIGKIFGIIWYSIKLLIISVRSKPDIFLNATQYSALVAWLLRKPHISIEDSFNMEQVKLYLPFTSAVLTATYDHPDLGKKDIRYDGYQELAYLHPSRFIPDPEIFDQLKIPQGTDYFILRFVSWNASHDYGQKGMSLDYTLKLINVLEKHGPVFISSEKKLPKELIKYKLNIPAGRIHDVLAYAKLFIGEGTTMASECAVLGTPAIYINSIERPYTTEQEEKYGLVFNFREEKGIIQKAESLLENSLLRETWKKKKEVMLKDKIDVTAFYIWFVENYPVSVRIMKANPEYQSHFR